MPCDYDIDVEHRLVRTNLWGEITLDELTVNQERTKDDPAFDPAFFQLADLQELTVINLTALEVQAYASYSPFVPEARRALVAPGDVAYGLGRMYSTFRQFISPNDQIRIFRDLKSAEEWLDLL